MTRNTRAVTIGLAVTITIAIVVTVSTATGWPFAHTFAARTWPGPFGWLASNTPGNLAAGFLQLGIGFGLGYGAHRIGVTERIKDWATRDIHAALHEHMVEVHDHLKAIHETVAACHVEAMTVAHTTHDAVSFPPAVPETK